MGVGISYAQNDTEEVVEVPSDSMQVAVMQDNMKKVPWNTDPLSPAKAAFYSAVIPGLGQIYNKSYWKVPLVYIAIGTPIYFYVQNSKEYDRYLSANKALLMMSFMAIVLMDNRVSVPMDCVEAYSSIAVIRSSLFS